MKRLMSLALFLVLAACGPLSNGFLTAQEQAVLTPAARVFQLQGEFNILLSQFNRYAAQPFCMTDGQPACAERVVVLRGEAMTQRADEVLDGASSAARAGASDIELAAAGARVAVAQLSRYLITEGIAR
ncbi:MAG: hypothetical protein ACTSX7_00110 [Alphaproteobacteria bacterium]